MRANGLCRALENLSTVMLILKLKSFMVFHTTRELDC